MKDANSASRAIMDTIASVVTELPFDLEMSRFLDCLMAWVEGGELDGFYQELGIEDFNPRTRGWDRVLGSKPDFPTGFPSRTQSGRYWEVFMTTTEEKVVSIEAGQKVDPFENLDGLKIGQDFAGQIGVKKVYATVPVRKPVRQDFVRVHPDENYSMQVIILELKEERESYLVAPELGRELMGEVGLKSLHTAINRQGTLFLWPVRLPGEDGRLDEWSRSSHKAVEMARDTWVRVTANMNVGAYEIFEPSGTLPDPEWPNLKFNEIMRIAFRDKFIRDYEHPVLKRLRGEI